MEPKELDQMVEQRARELISERNREAGRMGGEQRAKNLSPRKRKQIAKQGAAKRWAKK